MGDSGEEKGLLGPPLRSHRGYGTTAVNMRRPDHIIVHYVHKGDTIQGIALKYGASVSNDCKFYLVKRNFSINLHK